MFPAIGIGLGRGIEHMNTNQHGSMRMQASDENPNRVRAPLVVGIVAGLHMLAVSGFLMIQGCGTKQPAVEPPPAPVMPPRGDAALPPATVLPRPSFQPPVAVEQAPATLEAGTVQTYTVANGDSLSRIAKRFGVSVNEIMQLNGIKDPNKIRVGQSLKLPSYASPAAAPAEAAAPESAPKPKAKKVSKPAAHAVAGPGEYIVQPGDNLSKIAAKHGTTVKAIRAENQLQSDVIRPGQKLKLPAAGSTKPAATQPAKSAEPTPAASPAPATPAVEPTPPPVEPASSASAAPPVATAPAAAPLDPAQLPFEYTVRPGETIDDIARNFAVLKQEILSLNNLAEGEEVRAGQKLKIPTTVP